jgi:hypothetical protein
MITNDYCLLFEDLMPLTILKARMRIGTLNLSLMSLSILLMIIISARSSGMRGRGGVEGEETDFFLYIS